MNNARWLAAVALACVAVIAGCADSAKYDAPAPLPLDVVDAEGNVVGGYLVPADADIAMLPNADDVLYGQRLHNDTARLLPDSVGNGLNCNSCHIAQGKLDKGNGYINTVNTYPTYKPRGDKVINLKQRINGCFQRSMNGKALDPESREMTAMIAYMDWLRQDVPREHRVDVLNAGDIDTTLVPDPVRGQLIYAAQCAACHGDDGNGMKDQFGDYMFPPLWGDESFNIGAGLARTFKAAAYVKYNMPVAVSLMPPLGQVVLSDQDAVDVSEFFTHMPRPDFPGKANDFPGGKKPSDARY